MPLSNHSVILTLVVTVFTCHASFTFVCDEQLAGKLDQEGSEETAQAKNDVAVLLRGNLYSLGGEELEAILPRIKKNSRKYNQMIYFDLFSARSRYVPRNLATSYIPHALKILSKHDLDGSLANAKAYLKVVDNSLLILRMVREKNKLLNVLEKQDDLDDCNSLRRLISRRSETERLITNLQVAKKNPD